MNERDRDIIERVRKGERQVRLAEEYGISKQRVWQIIEREEIREMKANWKR